jgi:small subunit ribosomal protein S14
MHSLKIKDLKSRSAFQKSEQFKLANKLIFTNTLNKNAENKSASKKFFFIERKRKSKLSSKVIITRRCIINNRGRGVFRPFGISRVYLRELLQFGLVPGYSKAVW